MKTHELKLDIKYFDDVKSGKKNFEIRKNDRDFQVGDVLKLRAYVKGLKSFAKWGEIIDPFNNFRMSHNYMTCAEEEADTIKVKVTTIITSQKYNEKCQFTDPSILEQELNYKFGISGSQKILKDYFYTDRLPDGCVILGIEVVK